MPTFECVCGYSCGSARAWHRHLERSVGDGTAHTLQDPSLESQLGANDPPEGLGLALVKRDKPSDRHFSLDGKQLRQALQHESMPLIDAARHGDLSRLANLLATGMHSPQDLGRCDAAGMSAIAWAAKAGRCEAVTLLLEARASPNLVAEDAADGAAEAHPPLYLALTKARFDAARLLLDAGALAHEAEPVRRQTALHAACSGDVPLELLKRLLIALRRACADERLDDIDDCDDAAEGNGGGGGGDGGRGGCPPPLPVDSDGCTPLHSACANGQEACVEVLLERSDAAAELRRASKKRATPLAAACRRRHASLARLLVAKHGAPLDPLAVRLCLSKGQGDLLRELVTAAASRANDNREGASESARAGGVDVRSADDGVSALMIASEEGDEESVRALIAMGADVSAADRDGHTPLHRAAFMGHARVVAALAQARAVIDAVDKDGNSALHHAGRGSQEAIFELLELRYGADAEVRNGKGELPTVSAEPCRVQ